jgi:GAF domain-containing protein
MTNPDALLSELAGLARAVSPLLAPAGHEELLQSLTATARALFGAGACSLALLTDDEDELVYVAASGAGAQTVLGMRIGVAQGIAGWVMQSGQPAAISDLRRDARFARDVAEDTGYVPQAILAVPVTSPRGQIGVLTLLDRDPSREGAQFDLQTAGVFADQAALAIESAKNATDLGRMLLTQLADAAESGSTLRQSLNAATTAEPDRGLAAVAALLAELAARSQADRDLAVRVLRAFFADGDGNGSTR